MGKTLSVATYYRAEFDDVCENKNVSRNLLDFIDKVDQRQMAKEEDEYKEDDCIVIFKDDDYYLSSSNDIELSKPGLKKLIKNLKERENETIVDVLYVYGNVCDPLVDGIIKNLQTMLDKSDKANEFVKLMYF